MRLLFLDVDGVLNDHTEDPSVANPMQTVFVAQLKRIIDATGARIAWSTSRRRGYSTAQLDAMLRERGLDQESLGATPIHPGAPRHVEIRDFLRLCAKRGERFESVVVIDDDPLADLGDGTFVHCDIPCGYGSIAGLGSQLADAAIDILNRERP